MTEFKIRDLIWLISLLSISVAVLFSCSYTGWLPWDDGTMAWAADNVLEGRLPHRDFYDTHTGLLSLLHALAFSVLGENLRSLRTLYATSYAITVGFVLLGLRFENRLASSLSVLAIITLCATFYSAPLPTNYTTFFALLLWVLWSPGSSIRGPLTRAVLSGLCAGLAFLFKITGVYLLAASLLIVLFANCSPRLENRIPPLNYFWLVLLAVVQFLVLALLSTHISAASAYVLLFPVTAVLIFLGYRLVFRETVDSYSTIKEGAVCLIGFIAPIVVFLVPYLQSSSLDTWWNGVFILPQQRFVHSSSFRLPLEFLLTGFLLFTLSACLIARMRSKIVYLGASLIWFALLTLLPQYSEHTKYLLYHSLASWDFPLVVGSLFFLSSQQFATSTPISTAVQQPSKNTLSLFAIIAIATFHSLLQYPYYDASYHFYTFPLTLVLLATIATQLRGSLYSLTIASLSACFIWGLTNVANKFYISDDLKADIPYGTLHVERGGIFVPQQQIDGFVDIVETITAHSPYSPILAFPDCPEISFLSGQQNTLGTAFDFFLSNEQRLARINASIENPLVRVVVINSFKRFSPPLDQTTMRRLRAAFPNTKSRLGYEIRWRESSAP